MGIIDAILLIPFFPLTQKKQTKASRTVFRILYWILAIMNGIVLFTIVTTPPVQITIAILCGIGLAIDAMCLILLRKAYQKNDRQKTDGEPKQEAHVQTETPVHSRQENGASQRTAQQRGRIKTGNSENEILAGIVGKEKYLLLSDAWLEQLEELKEIARRTQQFVNKGPGKISYHEKSWGIAGGIAEGIAGPAAGVSAALDTIVENERRKASVDETNRQLRESWSQLNSGIGAFHAENRAYETVISTLRNGVRDLAVDDSNPEEKMELLKCEAQVPNTGGVLANGGQKKNVMVRISPVKPLKLNDRDAFMDGAILLRCMKGSDLYGQAYIFPRDYAAVVPERGFNGSAFTDDFTYDLSKASLCGTYYLELSAEAGRRFDEKDHYTFVFEPISLWLTEKKVFKGNVFGHAETVFSTIKAYLENHGGVRKAIIEQYQKFAQWPLLAEMKTEDRIALTMETAKEQEKISKKAEDAKEKAPRIFALIAVPAIIGLYFLTEYLGIKTGSATQYLIVAIALLTAAIIFVRQNNKTQSSMMKKWEKTLTSVQKQALEYVNSKNVKK